MKKALLLIFLSNFLFAKEEKTLLMIDIMQPIKVNETKNIKGKFTDLKDEAFELGVEQIYLNGNISYSKKGSYSNINITWKSIQSDKGLTGSNFVPLKKQFISSLTTDEKQILPPNKISVNVSKQILMQAINKMIDKNKDKPKEVKLSEKTLEKLSENKNKNNAATSVGNGKLSSSGLPSSDGLNANVVSSSQVTKECPVRYSTDDLKAYAQSRIDTVDNNGNTTQTGTCLDTGSFDTLVKDYSTPCVPLIADTQVYQSYRITGIVAGQAEIVRDCQVDLTDNILPVQTTTDQCNFSHDLANNVSYQTQRKYYELNGAIIDISQCQSNNTPYSHSDVACSYDLQVSPGFAVPQVKIIITLDDSSESIVQNCTTRNTQIPVILKECTGSQRYSHDFNAATSYLQKETWIENPYDNNVEVKLNDCQISTVSYPHLQTTNSCVPIFEDHNLLTNQTYKTFITDNTQTPSDIILDANCNSGQQIPYTPATISLSNNGDTKTKQYIRLDSTVYSRSETTQSAVFSEVGNYTWTVPDGITQIYAVVTSGGNGGNSGSVLIIQALLSNKDNQEDYLNLVHLL